MKTFKVKSTYEVEVVAEDKGQAREIIVNNAEKHSQNFYKNLEVEEKQEDVLERLQKEVGDTLTWWVEDQTVFFESVETNKQTEAYIDDFEYDFEKTLKIIKSELK